MRRTALPVVIVNLALIGLLLFTACSNKSVQISAELGQSVKLALNQAVSIDREPLKIRFLEVIGDSRCPRGVICVWEGEVSSSVEITYRNSPNRVTLTQRGSSSSTTDFNEYWITCAVQPYPEAGKKIEKQDYRLLITVNKKTP